MKRPKALVTGATGFIGSHLVRRLAIDGWDVDVIVRRHSNLAEIAGAIRPGSIHVYDGDVDSMSRIMKETAPDTVFHLASQVQTSHRPEDVRPMVESSVLFGAELLEAMAGNRVFNIVNTGTYAQHYEDRAYGPTCLYAALKKAFEDVLRYYVDCAGFKAITLTLFTVYGPGDHRNWLLSQLDGAYREGRTLPMSPGGQLLDMVYVGDVVDAYIAAAGLLRDNAVHGHEEYALSSGVPLSLKKIVAEYRRVTGRDVKVEWGGRPYKKIEIMAPWRTGKALPGWRPVTTLADGLGKTVERPGDK